MYMWNPADVLPRVDMFAAEQDMTRAEAIEFALGDTCNSKVAFARIIGRKWKKIDDVQFRLVMNHLRKAHVA